MNCILFEFSDIPFELTSYKVTIDMLNLQRRMGIDSYFEDHWTYFWADLRDDEGLTDMELVGVDDAGDFSSVKVSVIRIFFCLF